MANSNGRKVLWFAPLAVALQVAVVLAIVPVSLAMRSAGALVYTPVTSVRVAQDDGATCSLSLQFEISQVPREAFDYAPVAPGDIVFTPMAQEKQHWEIGGKISRTADPRSGIVSIGGAVVDVAGRGADLVFIEYGVETGTVASGSAEELARLVESNMVLAELSVDREGTAALERFFVDGHPWPR